MKMELLRPAIVERDGRQCFRCGTRDGFRWEVHHRKLRGQGGKNAPSNCLLLCDTCHHEVHSKRRLVGEPHGFLVPSWADPLETPVLHHQLGLVLLGDNFSVTEVLSPSVPGQ